MGALYVTTREDAGPSRVRDVAPNTAYDSLHTYLDASELQDLAHSSRLMFGN